MELSQLNPFILLMYDKSKVKIHMMAKKGHKNSNFDEEIYKITTIYVVTIKINGANLSSNCQIKCFKI
jgi:hypothetical protein